METPVTLLRPADRFPTFTVTVTDGGTLDLPDDLAGQLRRGPVLPRCVMPLLQRAAARLAASLRGLTDVGAKIVALPVDDEATTRELIANRHRTQSHSEWQLRLRDSLVAPQSL
jgi:hypothetical protein